MIAGRLRILLVNWQDILNPQAGGAEIHLHEIFGRLRRRGHEITLLCSSFPGAAARQEVDGLTVHRVGGRHSFALRAAPYYRRYLLNGGFDLVVEDINKIPLYTPLWVRPPVVALIPHLFGSTAFREVAFPLAATVWASERPIPYVYENVPFQAISGSTADDLVERGIPRSAVKVIWPGIDHSVFRPEPAAPPFPDPVFAYVGRLKRYKGVELVIEAVARLRRQGIEARLLVAGKGDYEPALRAYAKSASPAGAVEFLGYIPEQEKVDLLRRAWAIVYPSPKEGWGIANIEAAASGTPALASDSPGLRESVDHGRSGLLIPHGDLDAWSSALRRIILDEGLRQRLRAGAIEFAARFSWERTADETEAHLMDVLSGGRVRGHAHVSLPVSEVK